MSDPAQNREKILLINGAFGTNVSLASGYLHATNDTSANPPVPGDAGHVMGRLGQGTATMPSATNWAFAYKTTIATDATNGMMISIFPYDATDTIGIPPSK